MNAADLLKKARMNKPIEIRVSRDRPKRQYHAIPLKYMSIYRYANPDCRFFRYGNNDLFNICLNPVLGELVFGTNLNSADIGVKCGSECRFCESGKKEKVVWVLSSEDRNRKIANRPIMPVIWNGVGSPTGMQIVNICDADQKAWRPASYAFALVHNIPYSVFNEIEYSFYEGVR